MPSTAPNIAGAHAAHADEGLQHDLRLLAAAQSLPATLPRELQRRRALRWLAAGSLAPLGSLAMVACGGGGDSSSTTTDTNTDSGSSGSGTTTTTTGSCSVIPEETAGPYPGDGSNSVNGSVANALLLSGIVRSDITPSLGSSSAVASGVPLTLTLTLVNTSSSCASLAGYAVYLWHCDQGGDYSLYASSLTNVSYLRGVQEANASGEVTFTTIFPGCYSGRMPHIHFEVYPSLDVATSATHKVKTSQLSFPLATLNTVYSASGYQESVSNLASISFATDNVFSDGTTLQIAEISGSNSAGYIASLTVGIAA